MYFLNVRIACPAVKSQTEVIVFVCGQKHRISGIAAPVPNNYSRTYVSDVVTCPIAPLGAAQYYIKSHWVSGHVPQPDPAESTEAAHSSPSTEADVVVGHTVRNPDSCTHDASATKCGVVSTPAETPDAHATGSQTAPVQSSLQMARQQSSGVDCEPLQMSVPSSAALSADESHPLSSEAAETVRPAAGHQTHDGHAGECSNVP